MHTPQTSEQGSLVLRNKLQSPRGLPGVSPKVSSHTNPKCAPQHPAAQSSSCARSRARVCCPVFTKILKRQGNWRLGLCRSYTQTTVSCSSLYLDLQTKCLEIGLNSSSCRNSVSRFIVTKAQPNFRVGNSTQPEKKQSLCLICEISSANSDLNSTTDKTGVTAYWKKPLD